MPRKTIVITGASDGIGAFAAHRLHEHGHRVVLVGRNPEKTRAVATALRAEFHVADFSELEQVRALAASLLENHPRIDVLANNAGGIFTPVRETTGDGFEMTFQVNYLAPFLLSHLLIDRLIDSRASIINTSSVANRLYGHVDMDNLNSERSYSANLAYGNAKLEQIMFTRELQKRLGSQGLAAAAFHPGIVRTNFSKSPGASMESIYGSKIFSKFLSSPAKGADTMVWLAEGKANVDWPSGEFFNRRKISRPNQQANDPLLSAALWEESKSLLSLA